MYDICMACVARATISAVNTFGCACGDNLWSWPIAKVRQRDLRYLGGIIIFFIIIIITTTIITTTIITTTIIIIIIITIIIITTANLEFLKLRILTLKGQQTIRSRPKLNLFELYWWDLVGKIEVWMLQDQHFERHLTCCDTNNSMWWGWLTRHPFLRLNLVTGSSQ